MPLIHGKSKRAFKHNVETEIHEGKEPKQAVAIAYSEKRRARLHRAMGGRIKYDDGGKVAYPSQDQDDSQQQRAKQMAEGSQSGGPSMSQAWQNLKNETKSLFSGSDQKAGMAKGGEVKEAEEVEEQAHEEGEPVSHELMEMCADELCEAIEKKDRKGMIDAIKALVMSCME